MQDLAKEMVNICRFGTQLVRFKKEKTDETYGPWQVRFLDGARAVVSNEVAEGLMSKAGEELEKVYRPILAGYRERLKRMLSSPIIEEDVPNIAEIIDRSTAASVPPLQFLEHDSHRGFLGLDPAWVLYVDREREAREISQKLHQALGPLRLSLLNHVRVRIAKELGLQVS